MKWIDNMLGMKLFKEENDQVNIVRIIKTKKIGDDYQFTIEDSKGIRSKKMKKDLEGYTPLEPDAIFTASIVNMEDDSGKQIKDVIVTANKYIDTKMKMSPYVICRQNITDLFAELYCSSEFNNIVGMSVNRDTCPVNFDMKIMLAASSIEYHQLINFYRLDTLDDILKMVDIFKFDTVLGELYRQHCESFNPIAIGKDEDCGWCKSFRKLLETNNFQNDINQMLGITDLDFDITPYITEKQTQDKSGNSISIPILKDDMRYWLSSIYKINIKEVDILEFDHDIDLAQFKYSRYFIFRDNTKKMYLAIYTIEGEYLESDLEIKSIEMDFSTKFKINFYNKYNQINNAQINIDLS